MKESELINMPLNKLKSLRAKIDAIIEMKEEKDLKGKEYLLYLAIIKTINRKISLGLKPYKPDAKLKRLLLEANESIDSFLVRNVKNYDKVVANKFYHIFSDIIIDYLLEQDIPVTVKTVASFHTMFPSLLESNFPGYISNGLLERLL